MRLFRFPRSKTDHKRPLHPGSMEVVAELMQSWFHRMQKLLDARETAAPWQLPDIDAQIDQLCQEAAENIASPHNSELSVRLQRMKRLTLEELHDMRDSARQQR